MVHVSCRCRSRQCAVTAESSPGLCSQLSLQHQQQQLHGRELVQEAPQPAAEPPAGRTLQSAPRRLKTKYDCCPHLPKDALVSVGTLDGRKAKIHEENDQRAVRADGLGAVMRSNVTDQGTRQRAVFGGSSCHHIARLLPAQMLNPRDSTSTRIPRQALPGLCQAASLPSAQAPSPWQGITSSPSLHSQSCGADATGKTLNRGCAKSAPAALLMLGYFPKGTVPHRFTSLFSLLLSLYCLGWGNAGEVKSWDGCMGPRSCFLAQHPSVPLQAPK